MSTTRGGARGVERPAPNCALRLNGPVSFQRMPIPMPTEGPPTPTPTPTGPTRIAAPTAGAGARQPQEPAHSTTARRRQPERARRPRPHAGHNTPARQSVGPRRRDPNNDGLLRATRSGTRRRGRERRPQPVCKRNVSCLGLLFQGRKNHERQHDHVTRRTSSPTGGACHRFILQTKK